MTRTNMTVVPSDTPEPHQLHERVSLFNEDGSAFSGGGPKLVVNVRHDDSSGAPTEDFTSATQIIRGVDYSQALSNGPAGGSFFNPDYQFFFSGDSHTSWGTLRPGDIAFDMHPGKLYRWFTLLYVEPSNTATVMDNQDGFSIQIDASVVPDSVDGWSGSHNGFYPALSGEVAYGKSNLPGINPTAWTLAQFNTALNTQFPSKNLSKSGVFLNDGSTNQSLILAARATLLGDVRTEPGFLTAFKNLIHVVTEESI